MLFLNAAVTDAKTNSWLRCFVFISDHWWVMTSDTSRPLPVCVSPLALVQAVSRSCRDSRVAGVVSLPQSDPSTILERPPPPPPAFTWHSDSSHVIFWLPLTLRLKGKSHPTGPPPSSVLLLSHPAPLTTLCLFSEWCRGLTLGFQVN